MREGPIATPSFNDTAVVIPMHNEVTAIGGVIVELQSLFSRIICVDDGSSDDSARVAAQGGALVLRHPVNLGQGAALETGIRRALLDRDLNYVVTFDADGQHDVEDAAAMVRRARELGVQVVLGSRFMGQSQEMPRARRLLLRAAVRFTRHGTGLAVTDAHNGLRVLHRDAAEHVRLRLHGMSHASEILSLIAARGFSFAEHPVTVRYTDYSLSKGQRSYNALNIVFDLAVNRMRAA